MKLRIFPIAPGVGGRCSSSKKKLHPFEWYFALEDQFHCWRVLGIPPGSPCHKLGFDFLESQLDFSSSSKPLAIKWFRDWFLVDGTNVLHLELQRSGINFLCNLWQKHDSWRERNTDRSAEIPF